MHMQETAARPKVLFVAIGIRLMLPVVALVAAVTIGVYLGLVHQSRVSLLHSKEAAASMTVKFASTSVVPAVVFGDPAGMQRVLDDLVRDPEISAVELWAFSEGLTEDPRHPLASAYRAPGALGRPAKADSQLWLDDAGVRIVAPVVNGEGETLAALTARVSTAREAAALEVLKDQILIVSAVTAACLALAILFVIHRIVVRPIKRLEGVARKLARGESEGEAVQRAERRLENEVDHLETTFGEMGRAVRDRERRLGVRNAELKLILDSVQQGFATVTPVGSLLPEHSAIIDQWVGHLGPDETVWGLVRRIDARAAEWFEIGWSQLVDNMLPVEVALSQLPQRLERDGQYFDLAYHSVSNGEELQRVVFVLTDVTAVVERQEGLADRNEFASLVERLVTNRQAFFDFWTETQRLIEGIARETSQAESLKRDVHTLKGNSRFFGLTRLSTLCHELEDAMQDRGEATLTAAERRSLEAIWESLKQRMGPLTHGGTDQIQVSKDDYARLSAAVRQRKPFREIEDLVSGLLLEPTAARLEIAKDHLLAACQKLGKTSPSIRIEHNDLRLPPSQWAAFWSVLPHVLNNAADHGIDSDEARRAAGKPLQARVWLSTSLRDDELVVEVRDDGAGIDWDKVKALAAQRGLPAESRLDLTNALMKDEFSLKSQVTEMSGRGVGLAAVRSVVSARGGRIELESSTGQGCRWRFIFPINAGDASGAPESESGEVSARVAAMT